MTTQSSKLTAAQHALIAAATAHPTGALVPPAGRSGKPSGTPSRTLAKLVEALLGQGLVREVRTKADLPPWRQDESGKRYSVVLTKAGHATARAAAGQTDGKDQPGAADAGSSAAGAGSSDPGAREDDAASPRPGSKLAGVIDLLQRPEGAPVSALMAATGWLPHTTRAALTGLRKRGYPVVREAAEDGSVYRIQDGTAAAA